MKKTSKIYWLISLTSTFVGLLVGFSSIFIFIPFLVIAGVSSLAFLLNKTISKSKNETQKEYSLPVVALIILSIVVSVVVFYSKIYIQEFEAQKVVNELEVYRNQNGIYPQSLNEISYKTKSVNLDYFSIKDEYNITYSYDGWNRKSYNSKNKVWEIND